MYDLSKNINSTDRFISSYNYLSVNEFDCTLINNSMFHILTCTCPCGNKY